MKYNGQQEFSFATDIFNLRGETMKPETAPARETIPTEEEKRQAEESRTKNSTEELKQLEI